MPMHSIECVDSGSSLPPEVWAAAMEYLPCCDVLSCAASSRAILRDALPLLKTLHVDGPSQMNATVAARCRGVRELRITCLLRENAERSEGPDYRVVDVDPETSLRVVPFLMRFGRLGRVAFGGQRGDGARTAIDRFSPAECHYHDDDENEEYSLGMDDFVRAVESISGAFRVGALPRSLRVSGLCCPTLLEGACLDPRDSDPICGVCERACRSFPLRAVVGFGSGRGTARARDSGDSGFRACLTRAQIEGIVESRPGGRDALCSGDRILDLLRGGERYEVPSDDGGTFCVLKFGKGRLGEMKRIIRYAGTDLDPGGIDADSVADAILSGFAVDTAMIPPKIKRYVSEDSIEILAGYGLSVDAGKLNAPLNDYAQVLPQIGRVLLEHWSDESSLYKIEIDCLKLVRSLLEMECDPPIQAIIDLGLVPTMIILMTSCSHHPGHRRELGRIVNAIVSRGTEEQRMAVLATDDKVLASIKSQLEFFDVCDEYGPKYVVAAISTQLSASDTGDIECALSTLGCILDEKSDYATISTLSDAGVIPKLVRLLKRKCGNNAIVGRSLDALTLLSKHCIQRAMEAGLLPAVVETMGSVDSVRTAQCFVLLRRMLESWGAPVQKAIDLGVVPIALEGMKSNAEQAIRTNAAHVVVRLARGTAAETKSLSRDKDYVLAFIGLIQSSNKRVAFEAIESVQSIVRLNPELYQRMSEAGAVQRMWHIMQESKDSDTLSKATRAVVECVRRGKPSDHVTVNSMHIMSQELVVHADITVAVHACQGVLFILESFQEDGSDMMQFKEYVNNHFVKTMLSLLTQSENHVNVAVIEVVRFLTTIGEAFVQCLFDNHCLQSLKEMLLIPHCFHERLHKPVCDAIANIISGNADRIAGMISTGAMPVLVETMGNGEDRAKEEAFNVLYQVVKGGTESHVKHVASLSFIDHLICMMYTNNANILLPTLWILHKIYQVGSKGWQSCQTTKNADLQLVENVINESMDEHLRLEHEKNRIDLLNKRKALLRYIYKRKDVILLENLCSRLKDQSIEIQQQVQNIKNMMTVEQSSPGSTKVSLKLLFTLQEQRDGKKARNDKKMKAVEDKLRKAKFDLEWVFDSAVRLDEVRNWQKSPIEELEKMIKDDLPSDIAGMEVSLQRSSDTVKLINTMRLSEQRKCDIEALKTGLGGILGIKSGNALEGLRGDTRECGQAIKKRRRSVLDTESEQERDPKGGKSR